VLTTTLQMTFVARMLYVLVPGPATLAALNLSVSSGRRACSIFLGAHMLGDVFWSGLAITSIIGVSQIGSGLFDLLGIICGVYVCGLGLKALFGPLSASSNYLSMRPWSAGLLLGFSNPKAYPFALAVFAAVFAQLVGPPQLRDIWILVVTVFAGFLVATAFVIFWTGAAVTRVLYTRFSDLFGRATGGLFIGFGLKTIWGGFSDAYAA
jgi:threonine/homoserine/homoserine lactone efflux protein